MCMGDAYEEEGEEEEKLERCCSIILPEDFEDPRGHAKGHPGGCYGDHLVICFELIFGRLLKADLELRNVILL